MPLERETYTVYLAPTDEGPPTEHTVTVHYQDQLRGELAHNRAGMPDRGAWLNLTTAWVWAALTREGLYVGPFDRFRDVDCQGVEDAGTVTVDPTPPEAGNTPP